MSIEVEQKYRVDDREALLARITALDAVPGPTVTQVDTYYAHPARDFAATDEALRIRRVGDANCITYKGPKLKTETKARREIELPIAAGEASASQCDQLLQALSFSPVIEVSKTRQIFHIQRSSQTVELAVDHVQRVGHFVELEIVVPDETKVDAAQQIILALATELQLKHVERRSYLEMLLE